MTKKIRIRIWIVVVIIWLMWFSDWSFAADGDDFKILWRGLNYLVSALSWIWVFFAKLAWTFLTNEWVYWEALWFDVLLWKLRNVMKNIANFGLWFYFVYTVFKWLINQWKEDITKKLKSIILWLLIAWVWIQASWFFTAAVIDVSTVTLVAAWSFPSQMISESPYVEWSIKKSLEQVAWKGVSLFPKDWKATSFIETFPIQIDWEITDKKVLDAIMPNQEDVAGPLYFIWFTILKTDVVTSVDTTWEKGLKWTILNTILQWWTTIVFAFEMLMLCIIALIRIAYLWMFIILSPIAVLLWCIQQSWDKVGGGGNWFFAKFTKQISFKSFFVNVFKPTFIVLWFWIAVIFVWLMNQVVLDYTGKTFDIKGSELTSIKESDSNINGHEWDQTYTTIIDDNFLHFVSIRAWKTMLEIALCVITVIIVYLIINLAMKIWNSDDFASKYVDSIHKSFGKMASSLPVIPVAWYDKKWLRTTSSISRNALTDLPRQKLKKFTWDISEITAKQEEEVMKMWWVSSDNSLSPTQQNAIRLAWQSLSDGWAALGAKKTEIDKISKDWKKWMTLNPDIGDKFWIQEFTKWLDERADKNDYTAAPSDWKNMIWDWKKYDKDKRDLQKLFSNTRYATAYANFFGYKWNYSDFNSIKDLDISDPNKTK